VDDNEKRFVNELLDASLRRYAGAEPRPGLEGRVLAGVRTRQQAARRRTAWAWAIGITTVATMVALLVIHLPRRQPAPLPAIAKGPANVSAPAATTLAPPVQPRLPRRPRRRAPPAQVDTRPQQFPTPRPLSEQEKLLVAYAQALKGSSTPASAWRSDQYQEHDLEIPPLSIAAIKIEPLAPPEKIGDEK